MDLLKMFLISVQFTFVFTRKKHVHDSDESIENLLYYQDCKHKSTEPPPPPPQIDKLRATQPENTCPFPKMCCTMSCGGECSNQYERQLSPAQPMLSAPPMEPSMHFPNPAMESIFAAHPPAKKRRKINPIVSMDGRRNFGFTREKIKGLISHDQDIKHILKDLVKVTLQKANLDEVMHRQDEVPPNYSSQEVDEF